MHMYPSSVTVKESVKEVVYAAGQPKEGMRELIVHPRCRILRMEMNAYATDDNGAIIKQHDHGPDALRTMIWAVKRGDAIPSDYASGVDGISVDDIYDEVQAAYNAAYNRARVADVYSTLQRLELLTQGEGDA